MEGDQGKPNVEFTQDGVLKSAELKIMNLRPGLSKQLVWEEVSEKRRKTSLSLVARIFRIDQRVERNRTSGINKKNPSWKILVSFQDSRGILTLEEKRSPIITKGNPLSI